MCSISGTQKDTDKEFFVMWKNIVWSLKSYENLP